MDDGCTACKNSDKFRQLQGCTIRNETDDDIEVEIRRKPVNGKESVILISGLTPNQSQHIGVHSAMIEDVGIRNPIDNIKVTLSNGEKHEIHAPFEGITCITRDWLFTVDKTQIKSVHGLDNDSH